MLPDPSPDLSPGPEGQNLGKKDEESNLKMQVRHQGSSDRSQDWSPSDIISIN